MTRFTDRSIIGRGSTDRIKCDQSSSPPEGRRSIDEVVVIVVKGDATPIEVDHSIC